MNQAASREIRRRVIVAAAVIGTGAALTVWPISPASAQAKAKTAAQKGKAAPAAKAAPAEEKDANLPKDPFDRGLELHRQGRLQEALTAFQQAEEKDKKDPIIQSWLGYVNYKLNKYDDAITYLNRALEYSPKKDTAAQANIYNNLGNAYLEKGDTDNAIASYQKAVEVSGTDAQEKRADIHYNLGRALIAKQDLEASLTALQEAERRDPNDPLIQNNLGYVYERLNAKDPTKYPINLSIEHYRKAAAAQPGNPVYQRNLGLAARRGEGRSEEAFKALQQAVQLDKKDYDSYVALAEEYQARQQFPQAIQAYTTATSLRPGEFVPHYNLGLLHARQGNYREATAQLTDAYNVKKDDVRVLSALGWVNFRANRFDEAVKWYGLATQQQPDLQPAHANLGLAYDRLGRTDDAIKRWEEALRLDPKDTATRTLLAAKYLDPKRRYEDAVAEYKIILQEQPKDAQSWNNLGFALEKLGRSEESMAAYQKAIGADAGLAIAHNNLGAAYQRLGQLDKAREHYRKALQIDPNLPDPKKNLANLDRFQK